jgi:hypothetical protein
MFPSVFFNLFPPFPHDNKVFVAMSFDSIFDRRWNEVIAPAIKRVEFNGTRLEPLRVDARRVSDSIITEILTGISRSKLILADISTVDQLEGKSFRNGNVMYEVGLAHAVRMPEEVLLFRSDRDPLVFDMANVRVNYYEPDVEPTKASDLVIASIIDAIKEIDLRRSLTIKSAADSLDFASWSILLEAMPLDGMFPPQVKTMGQALGNAAKLTAISRLLELGALSTAYIKISPDVISNMKDDQPAENMLKYRLTAFGRTLVEHILNRMNILSADVQNALKAKFVVEPTEIKS